MITFDFDDRYKNLSVPFDLMECKNQSLEQWDEVQFELINTDQGICSAVDLSKPGQSKRTLGVITRIDKSKKTGFLKSNDQQYSFAFFECNGFNANHLTPGTRIEYELRYIRGYKATKICLHLLPYQWLTYDESASVWKPHSLENSLQFEKAFTSNSGMDEMVSGQNKRVTVYQRKVTELKSGGGYVEANYHRNGNANLWFDFKDLKFDAKLLRKGDDVIYELKKEMTPKPRWKVVDIRFANFIPYYWMVLRPMSNSMKSPKSRQQKPKWSNVPFGQNAFLERKYNSENKDHFEVIDPNSGTKYRRNTVESPSYYILGFP